MCTHTHTHTLTQSTQRILHVCVWGVSIMTLILLRALWSIMQQETEWKSFVPDSTHWGYEREGGENEGTLQELSKAGGIQENSGQTGVAGILLFLNKVHWARINSDTRLGSHGPKQPTEEDNPDACTPTHWCHGNLPVPWPGSLVFPNTVREV